MGNFKVYTTFNKGFGQTTSSAWKCPKTQFWGRLTNWKFEPSPWAHTHSDPIISKHTKQVNKPHMDLSWHALNWYSKDLATYYNTPTKTHWSWAQFQKGQPTPCIMTYAFSRSPLGWRVLATNLLLLTGPGLRSTNSS